MYFILEYIGRYYLGLPVGFAVQEHIIIVVSTKWQFDQIWSRISGFHK